jgi:O-antigen/teichoic acid export membrane protein
MKFNLTTKKIFLYGLGLISMKTISLLMLPIITHFLNPSDYGTLEILLNLINLLGIIVAFGLNDALFRFGGMAESKQIMEKICNNAEIQALIICLVFYLPMILFAGQLAPLFPGNVTPLQIILLGLALIPSNVLVIQLDWLRLNDKAIAFVCINLLRAIIQASMVLITLYAGYGVTGFMFASVISTFTIFVYFIFVQFKNKIQFDMDWQKKLFFFGLPLSFSGIAEFIIMWLNIWWLAYVVGPAEMALYALAMKFSIITLLLMQPIVLWWNPNRFKYLKTIADRTYSARISEAGAVLGFVFALGVAIVSSIIIKLFTPATYHMAISYLPWLSFMFAMKNAAEMMNPGLFLHKTYYQMWINTLTAIFTVIGFYFLIHSWKAWGVILVLNIAFAFRWFAFVYLSQRELYLPFQYLKLFIFIIVIVVSITIVQSMSSVYDYIIKGGTLWVLATIFSFYLKLLPRTLMKNLQ